MKDNDLKKDDGSLSYKFDHINTNTDYTVTWSGYNDQMEDLNYKFNEGKLIAELKEYIDSTYDGHYSKNKFQSTEFIIDCGHGMGFALGNVLKYAQRYGKKDGFNRKDIMKILHYAIIALSVHDNENEGDAV